MSSKCLLKCLNGQISLLCKYSFFKGDSLFPADESKMILETIFFLLVMFFFVGSLVHD